MAIKKKDHEKLDASHVKHVISLLEAEKSITKKDACEILNISYNTKRLQKIIEECKEREAYITRRKAQNRGKRASKVEIRDTIIEYLEGENIAQIAKGLFRSSGFVKGILERLGVPTKESGIPKGKATLLPEACRRESFEPGEIIWSAKYHAPAVVVKENTSIDYVKKYLTKCYRIYVMEPVEVASPYFPQVTAGGFSSDQLAYDLGSLEHLKQYGVKLNRL